MYEPFVEQYAALVRRYVLGDPLDPATTLGPVVRTAAADLVRAQIAEALARGARALIDAREFPRDEPGTPYLAPQVLVDVDHSMRVMTEESFGPVVGIARVASDEEAVARMNDSEFGLTASVWTRDERAALALGARVETGTFFMNRCDYLDPALAWTGVKNSGRGCTLSRVGFEQLTRPEVVPPARAASRSASPRGPEPRGLGRYATRSAIPSLGRPAASAVLPGLGRCIGARAHVRRDVVGELAGGLAEGLRIAGCRIGGLAAPAHRPCQRCNSDQDPELRHLHPHLPPSGRRVRERPGVDPVQLGHVAA